MRSKQARALTRWICLAPNNQSSPKQRGLQAVVPACKLAKARDHDIRPLDGLEALEARPARPLRFYIELGVIR